MTATATALRLALSALVRDRLRSALTMLGILIGIGAVVLVTALSAGARAQITAQIETLGSNLIFVFGRSSARSGARTQVSRGLRDVDAEAIRREASAVESATVFNSVKAQVVSELGNADVDVMGVDRHYFEVRGYVLEAGRRWTPSEEASRAKVCLMGKTAVENVFGGSDPVGKYVRIGRYPFLVVGVLAPRGASPFEDQDDRVLMPLGSWAARISPVRGGRVQLIIAKGKSADQVPVAERQIEAILRQRHGIGDEDEPDFRIHTQEQFRQSQEQVFGVLTMLLISVAGIALFVGGVGVMNIMLVSVTERTREIGLRMAIGARREDIQAQFLFEAMTLTLLGGVLGVGAGFLAAEVLERTAGWSVIVEPGAVAAALGVSLAVGLCFGYLPAVRAASLDPIEGLRHE